MSISHHRLKAALIVSALTFLFAACDHIDFRRIPVMPVYIPFATVGDWNTSGVGGALDSRIFIKEQNKPASYHYSALSATGFGGVLLIGDVNGDFCAYDLACPVERRPDVRVAIDPVDNVAVCPVCHSTYNVISLGGYPLTGPAAEHKYGLRRYSVISNSTYYRLITN